MVAISGRYSCICNLRIFANIFWNIVILQFVLKSDSIFTKIILGLGILHYVSSFALWPYPLIYIPHNMRRILSSLLNLAWSGSSTSFASYVHPGSRLLGGWSFGYFLTIYPSLIEISISSYYSHYTLTHIHTSTTT